MTDSTRAAVLDALPRRAWLEIDEEALAGNLRCVRSMVGPEVRIAAVVKADAYGHGLVRVARTFVRAGADRLCVATLDEAVALRAAIPETPVLVLFSIPPGEVIAATRSGIELVASDEDTIAEMLRVWSSGTRPRAGLRLHVEVETGLGRAGVAPEAVIKTVGAIEAARGATVAGLWSHLARPEDEPFSTEQERRLSAAAAALSAVGLPVPPLHLAGTGGLFGASCGHHSMVRPGLALYGELPDGLPIAPLARSAANALRPAMTLKARPLRVVAVEAGTPIGYGGRWVAQRPSRIATLPVGYGDGFARPSQPGGMALVKGVRVPLAGTVAMDAVAVDVTDVADVDMDDEFVLLGAQGDERITATESARRRNTISWEVLCGMAQRLPRVYHAGPGVTSVRTLAGESTFDGTRAVAGSAGRVRRA